MQKLHPLAERLTSALLEVGPPAITDWSDEPPQSKVEGDDALLDRVWNGQGCSIIQRIWTNASCLVATRSQSRNPKFGSACAHSGIPVAVRRSGGTTIVHHAGTLQISLGLSLPQCRIDDSYRMLTSLISRALAHMGIEAEVGPADGSLCNGRHSVLVDGRKLAGTAAFTAVRKGAAATVAHAVIAVAGNPLDDITRVTKFDRVLGGSDQFRPETHCTLESVLGLRSA